MFCLNGCVWDIPALILLLGVAGWIIVSRIRHNKMMCDKKKNLEIKQD